MPPALIVFFICWLTLVTVGAVLIVYIWSLLTAKYGAQHAQDQEQFKQSRSTKQ